MIRNDGPARFRAPSWYLLVFWPLIAVVLTGIVFLGVFLVEVAHGRLSDARPGLPWVGVFGMVLTGGGAFVGRSLLLVLAIQRRRWAKAHAGEGRPRHLGPPV